MLNLPGGRWAAKHSLLSSQRKMGAAARPHAGSAEMARQRGLNFSCIGWLADSWMDILVAIIKQASLPAEASNKISCSKSNKEEQP